MEQDSLLKTIFLSPASQMIPSLFGGVKVKEFLNVEFPSVRRRFPDVVVRLEDGRIVHLEIQTRNERRMPWRMLEYYMLLRRRYPDAVVAQMVLYVGLPALRMDDYLEVDRLRFAYEIIDIRTFEPGRFLNSVNPAERVLSLLCSAADPSSTIRSVLESWSGESRKELATLLEKLVLVSGLRRLERKVHKEVAEMPFDIDELIRENAVIQEWIKDGREKGLQEGRQKGLQEGRQKGLQEGLQEGRQEALQTALHKARQGTIRLVEHRFGSLPAWAVSKIEKADTDTLSEWSIRTLDARVLEEVFA